MQERSELNAGFRDGLVCGFDVGTTSLGYAVRRGDRFLEAGVLVFPEEVGNLGDRRANRRQRRTMRSRKIRLRVLRERLAAAGLPRPGIDQHEDPVGIRLGAVRGEELSGQELHAALFHLLRRRGYARPPWAASEGDEVRDSERGEDKKEEGEVRRAVDDIRQEMAERGERYPCEWLARRSREEKPRRGKPDSRVVFPRDLREGSLGSACVCGGRPLQQPCHTSLAAVSEQRSGKDLTWPSASRATPRPRGKGPSRPSAPERIPSRSPIGDTL